jgi:hypothetical protein
MGQEWCKRAASIVAIFSGTATIPFGRLSLPMNRMTFLFERFSLIPALTRSRPLARLLRNLWLRQILFAASQAAQISRWEKENYSQSA